MATLSALRWLYPAFMASMALTLAATLMMRGMKSPIFGVEMRSLVRNPWRRTVHVLYGLLLASLTYLYVDGQTNHSAELFEILTWVQLGAVALGAALTASEALAKEVELKTVDLLLLTDLTAQEIVLGKLVPRMLWLLGLLAAGLPVFLFAAYTGQADGGQTLRAIAIMLIAIFVGSGLAMLASMIAPAARDALIVACGFYILFYGAIPSFFIVLQSICGYIGISSLWIQEVFRFFQTAHPGYVLDANNRNLWLGGYQHGELVAVLSGWSALLAWRAVRFVIRVIDRSRIPVAEQPPAEAKAPEASAECWPPPSTAARRVRAGKAEPNPKIERKPAPPVGDHALLWKEVQFANRSFLHAPRPLRFALVLFVLVAGAEAYLSWRGGWTQPKWMLFSQLMTMTAACAGVPMAAICGAYSIANERQRGTWLPLVSAPLDASDLVLAKVLGSMVAAMRCLRMQLVLWPIALALRPSLFLAPAVQAALACVFTAFAGILGVWFSLVAKNSLRAAGWALAFGCGLAVAPTYLDRPALTTISPIHMIITATTYGDAQVASPEDCQRLWMGMGIYAIGAALLFGATVAAYPRFRCR